jgi:hypothetical protein
MRPMRPRHPSVSDIGPSKADDVKAALAFVPLVF